MKKYAVVTGDVVGFTSVSADEREALINETEKLIASWVKEQGNARIFRGDSFQLLFEDIPNAIYKSIQLRCWFKKSAVNKQEALVDAKMAIGIGGMDYYGSSVLDSDGEAFHLSGRTFDAMGTDEFLRIVTSDKKKNDQLAVILGLSDIIISNWTAGQAEVIYMILEGKTQQQMAAELQIVQSAVNNRIKLAKWKEVEKALRYIITLIET